MAFKTSGALGIDSMDDPGEKASEAQEIHAPPAKFLVFCMPLLIGCETIEQSVATRAAQIGLRTATARPARGM